LFWGKREKRSAATRRKSKMQNRFHISLAVLLCLGVSIIRIGEKWSAATRRKILRKNSDLVLIPVDF
jgi:hypothetical protein